MLKATGLLRLRSALQQRQITTGIVRLKRRKTAEEKVRPGNTQGDAKSESSDVTEAISHVEFNFT